MRFLDHARGQRRATLISRLLPRDRCRRNSQAARAAAAPSIARKARKTVYMQRSQIDVKATGNTKRDLFLRESPPWRRLAVCSGCICSAASCGYTTHGGSIHSRAVVTTDFVASDGHRSRTPTKSLNDAGEDDFAEVVVRLDDGHELEYLLPLRPGAAFDSGCVAAELARLLLRSQRPH
jgi:hypothetical protein